MTSNQHFLIRNRNMRNELLNQTDRYLLNDYPITEEQKTEVICDQLLLDKTFNRNQNYQNQNLVIQAFHEPLPRFQES